MDDIKVNQNPKLGSMDRPNSYIGRSLPREYAKKHLEGGGQFVDEVCDALNIQRTTLWRWR